MQLCQTIWFETRDMWPGSLSDRYEVKQLYWNQPLKAPSLATDIELSKGSQPDMPQWFRQVGWFTRPFFPDNLQFFIFDVEVIDRENINNHQNWNVSSSTVYRQHQINEAPLLLQCRDDGNLLVPCKLLPWRARQKKLLFFILIHPFRDLLASPDPFVASLWSFASTVPS